MTDQQTRPRQEPRQDSRHAGPPTEVLDRLFRVFRSGGYDAASLADIAAATGLGKSSLYHHFPGGKEEMAVAVIERVAAALDTRILAPLRQEGAPEARIEAMLAAVAALYDDGRHPCVVGLFALGSMANRFQPRLEAIFAAWVDALAEVLRGAGQEPQTAAARAEDAVIRIQGALVLSQAFAGTGPFERTLAALRRDLLGA